MEEAGEGAGAGIKGRRRSGDVRRCPRGEVHEENGGEVGCGEERVGERGERPLLPLNHHPHPQVSGSIPPRSAEEADEPEVGVTGEIDGNGSSFGGVDAMLERGGKGAWERRMQALHPWQGRASLRSSEQGSVGQAAS
jgi:hypothetical protein